MRCGAKISFQHSGGGRGAWEREMPGMRHLIKAERSEFQHSGGGRGASELHSHAERGNEKSHELYEKVNFQRHLSLLKK
jgi:hypothetical protein